MLLNYVIVGIAGILAVFSFVMGIEKMIKIILWNYVLTGICLAAWESINVLIKFLLQAPQAKTIWFTHAKIANFLEMGHTTFVLMLYIWLLIVIYLKSKIRIDLPSDSNKEKLLYVILIPMTVISIILTLQIALIGTKILDINHITTLTSNMQNNNYAYKFISLTPVRTFLHGIATILITSELNISFKSNSSSPLG